MRIQAMFAAILAMGLCGPVAATADKARPDPVHFKLRPVVDPVSGDYQAVDFSLRFRGERDGTTEITLPNDWGGLVRGYERITGLKAEGATLTAVRDPAKRTLRHRPGATITVHWRIAAAPWKGDSEFQRIDDYSPIVTSKFFYLLGPASIIRVGDWDEEVPLVVDLPTLAPGQSFASDLEHGGMGQSLTFHDLIDSVTVGGDFQVIDAGQGQRLAIRGAVDSRDVDGWRDSFQRVATTQRQFWNSDETPYLVTILTFAPPGDGFSTGGTGLGDAFAFTATRNADPKRMDETMMHEMAHSWVPVQMGRSDLTGGREAEGYWFSEGFTDYVTMRTMVMAGFWTPEMFAEKLNDLTLALASSPYVAAPNAEAAKLFWTDRRGQQLPYQRGALFAFMLDDLLRKKSGGTANLDYVLRDMVYRAPKEPDRDAIALLRVSMAERGINIGPLIAKHIDRGEPIKLSADAFAACGALAEQKVALFDAGFDYPQSFNGKKAQGVRENGPAWRGGLRNGMVLEGWSLHSDDAQKPVEVVAVVDGKASKLSWLPASDNPAKVQRLSMTPHRSGPECGYRLGATRPDAPAIARSSAAK